MKDDRFRMGPFPCPHCGHVLLVDAIRAITVGPKMLIDPEINYEVDNIFDRTARTPDMLPYEAKGRYTLVRELKRADQEIAELKRQLAAKPVARTVLDWIRG